MKLSEYQEQPIYTPHRDPNLGIDRLPKPGLIVRFFALLWGGEVVWLKDWEGEVYQSIAMRDAFGGMYCYVHWFNRIGRCQLLNDGTVDPCSPANYIKKWVKA